MQYINTTELRTKSSKLIDSLLKGSVVSLVHRSKIVGKIQPVQESQSIIFDAAKFKKFIDSLGSLKRITKKEREKIYRKHLQEKYGKGVS